MVRVTVVCLFIPAWSVFPYVVFPFSSPQIAIYNELCKVWQVLWQVLLYARMNEELYTLKPDQQVQATVKI